MQFRVACVVAAVGSVFAGSGCGGQTEAPAPVDMLSMRELADPASCQECHPDHYDQWSGSMHAYAAEDPVFRAMNARAQEETGGALGDFCVRCHAPVALALGLTTDGTNLDDVPQAYHGVTCYFCHQVDAVEGTHNNPLRLAFDDTMRGPFADPAPGSPHRSAYSPLHDRTQLESGDLCGTCHDIVNPKGVHIERTYTEWLESLYATDDPATRLTCNECHMHRRDGVAADVEGVPLRRVSDHAMPGVDVALTDWPHREEQRTRVERLLATTLLPLLCVDPLDDGGYAVAVFLHNVAAGHMFPSGAASDRRAWVELAAYDDQGQIRWSSGLVADDQAAVDLEDPNMWLMRDTHYADDGQVTHKFWETASYTSVLLPPPIDVASNNTLFRGFTFSGFAPARITMRVRLRPIGFDVLDELIASGHLAPEVRDAMPTFDLAGTVLEWTPDIASAGSNCTPQQ